MWEFSVLFPTGDPAMKRTQYTEEQMILILKEDKVGASAIDLARLYRIAVNPIYCFKLKLDGMNVSEVGRPRELASENSKMIRLPELDRATLKELISGSWWQPGAIRP